jgi:hypothetical protein
MRVFAAALLAVVACVAAAPAGATNQPPIGLAAIHVVKLKPQKHARSCAARPRSRTAADRITRKLSPVACEQPPKANVLDLGVVLVLRP